MKLATEVFGEVVVAHTPEEVGEERAATLVDCLTSLGKSQVVVDLDGTESIDSAGLTALLDAQESLRRGGGDLKLAMSNAINRKIFEITRLDQQLEVFDSVIDAVKSFM
jgi:anti-anti-sigma factor